VCDLYRSADVVTVLKRKMLRWAGYVARMDITQKGSDLYRSADDVRVLKRKMLRWAGYVARMDITQNGSV